MSSRWQSTAQSLIKRLRDLALTVLVFGVAQILISFLLWLMFFRSHLQGFSMALTLVGFGGWFIGFVASIGVRRGMSQRSAARQPDAPERPAASASRATHPWVERFQEQIEGSGCSTVLLFSSLLPLALAFVLRLQADMQSGKTWNDIFPKMP